MNPRDDHDMLRPTRIPALRELCCAATFLFLAACEPHHEAHASRESPAIVVTTSLEQDVEITQRYVALINARRHIVVRAQHKEAGYLEEIHVKEGQHVEAGAELFRINPTLYEARYRAELAEVKFAEQEYRNAKQLFDAPGTPIISEQELRLYEAKLARAEANAAKAKAELDFTSIKAPFDGIIDRQLEQQGSLIKEGDELTTLSDNTVMWVYFNVPEAQYLDYTHERIQRDPDAPSTLELPHARIELRLANGTRFPQEARKALTIEGEFQRETGNIQFRADFPNPDGILRHGQTGTVLIHQLHERALVIPQRATFEILDRSYVYVVGADNVVHQREIEIEHELADIFVIAGGLTTADRIVLDGVQLIHDGLAVGAPQFRQPEEVLERAKFRAE
jgi:membrane fusion protein (multidrug efflux system)